MIYQPSPIRRLTETIRFFRVYGLKLGGYFFLLYLPVIVLDLLLPGMAEEPMEQAAVLGRSYIIHFLYQPIYTGALIYWLARIESGASWSLKDGLIVGISFWDQLILVNLISFVLVIVGVFAFIVPGLIAYARLSLAEYRVVLNGENAKSAIRGSFRITRPFAWEILASSGILFFLFLFLELVFGRAIAVLSGGMAVDLFMRSALSIVFILNLTILLYRFYGLAGESESISRDDGGGGDSLG